MAVVAFPYGITPRGPSASEEWELRSITGRFFSPLSGYTRTLERVGSHWAVHVRTENITGAERARWRTFLASCRGQANRFYLPLFAYTQRGSFSAPELFSNPYFASGTTGWTPTNATLTTSDGGLRVTATTPAANVQVHQSAALTLYAPHALRSILIDGPQTSGLSIGRFLSDTSIPVADYSTARGLGTVSLTAASASATNQLPAVISSTTGFTAGAYLTVVYTSLARCALVDNGPNVLTRSDDLSHADWVKTGTTATADYYTAPDGTATGDRLIEDTSTGEHRVSQTKTRTQVAADWSLCVALRRGDVGNLRDRAWLRIFDSGGTNNVNVYFDLTAGTIAIAAAAGGAAGNPRAFITDLGGGWYYCCLVGQIPASDTTIIGSINLVQNPSTVSYTGSSSQNIGVWRATLVQSSVPTRLRATTTAATSGTAQTGGAIYLKGLLVSTAGLLLKDDVIEVITPSGSELKRVLAPLNSDAAGLGYLQFEPPMRESPADGAAVIVTGPLMRAMLDENTVRWLDKGDGFSQLEFTAVEDMTA